MRTSVKAALVCGLVAAFAVTAGAEAQRVSSLGAGVALPTSSMGDVYDAGWTVRGQVGFSLLLLEAHVQTGWSRFPGKEYTSGTVTVAAEDIDIYHAGVGARAGLGFIWVGANAAYFFGDGDEGLGVFPEVGTHIGPVEAVVDYRIDGDYNWLGARVGWRF